MAKKRITELATETTLKDGQYVAIDHTTDGTKKLNLGAELTNLKEDLEGLNANIANGSPTLLVFDWTRGENWKNGNDVFVANINYRVCNSNPFSYPVDLKITHTGYAIKLFMDTNHDGTYATTIPWWKDPYTIPANTPTYISIKRITEDTSETAIIDDFVNALEVSPIIAKENEFQDVKKVIYESNYVSVTADDSVVGKYIGKDGGVSDLAKYTILCFYLDKNDVLRIKSSNGVSDVSVIAFISVWQNDVFQYVYGDSVDGSETDDIFIANENCEVRVVTRNNNSSYSYSFYKAKYALASSNYIEKLIQKNSEVKASILSAFKNITCIGDSLTWSQVYTGASSSRQAFTPYPKVIEALTGVTATILATAGYSAVDNWSEYNDDMVQKDGQLAIVYLGTNEGLTDTIDTDMVGDDYTQWSNTNTGCYGKIIAKLLSVNSRVVLVKVHSSSGNVTTTNTVIDKMGTKFNVPVISNEYLSGAKYHSYPDGSGTNGTHYNDIGYAVFARQIIDKISTLSDADILKILPL